MKTKTQLEMLGVKSGDHMNNLNSSVPENVDSNKTFLDAMNLEKARIYVKREGFKSNLVALQNGQPTIEIDQDREKYFDENNHFIPQRLGNEIFSIINVKKGQDETLFYLSNDGTYKPAEQRIKQLIPQLLGDRYNSFAERDTLTYIRSSLPEEKIKTSGIPKLTALSTVKAEEVNWLDRPRVPIGKITMLEGDPGLGKTFVALKEAATVSIGGFFIAEDGTLTQKVDSGKVLYLTAEDGLGDTLRPRLEKMGANLENIFALEGKIIPGKDEVELLSLLDMDVLRSAVNEVRPALIIIDPIQAYLGPGVNMNRAEDVRQVLTPVSKLAEEFKFAVIIIRHLTKSGKDKASYRGMGSIDFTAAARSVLLVGKDPGDETKRVIVQTKSSLAETSKSIAFTINNGLFEWLGHSEVTAAEVLAPERLENEEENEEDKNPMKEARKYLIDSLKDGPKLAKELIDSVKYLGFGRETLRKAKSALKIKSYKKGSDWFWAFPPDAEVKGEGW